MDPETELVDHVYFGCTRRAVPPSRSAVLNKQKLFAQLMAIESSDPNEGGGKVMGTIVLIQIRSPKGAARAVAARSKQLPARKSRKGPTTTTANQPDHFAAGQGQFFATVS